MVSYDVAKSLWKWRSSLVKKHIENKKAFLSREEAIEALKVLAQSHNIKITETR
jgi:CMP-2-keto-3-deoxyoctulosonic acid synthetase